MSNKNFSRMIRRWLSHNGRAVTKPRRSANAWLRVEEIEKRVVPASFTTPLPGATVAETQTIIDQAIADNTRPQDYGFQAQAAIDPTNPQRMVVVRALGSIDTGTHEGIFGEFTLDGGSSWNTFRDPGGFPIPASTNFVDPTTPPNPYAFMSSPSVAFARDGTVYLTYLVHNATYSSGAIIAKSFTFDPANGPQLLHAAQILYIWVDPTGGTQNQALNPSVAVDNNLPRFIDPVTGEISTDTMAGDSTNGFFGKAAYITWNTNTVRPGILTDTIPIRNTPFNPNAIFVVASGDKGANWTTPLPVNDGLGLTFPTTEVRSGGYWASSSAPQPLPHFSPSADPHIVFSPPEVNPNATVTPGSMKFYWSTVENQNPAFQVIRQDTSQPDSGVAGNTAASAATFNGATGQIDEPTIPASGNGPDIPNPDDFNNVVTLPANFGKVTDLNVTVTAFHPHVNQISVVLIPPASSKLPSVILLLNRTLGDGTDRPVIASTGIRPGVPDNPNLGVLANGSNVGTTFDQEAPDIITDQAIVGSPYTASFRPEVFSGSASLFDLYGKDASVYNGTWKLEITDFRDDDRQPGFTPGLPIPTLRNWSLHFSGQIDNDLGNTGVRFGADTSLSSPLVGAVPGTNEVATTITPIRAGINAVQPTTTIASPNVGVNTGVSFAYDTSQGSASPYSGRLYAVYTGFPNPGTATPNNTDIFLVYSDRNGLPNPDGSTSWSDPIRVNDDSIFDQFTGGNRAQFQPEITVDPVTGTVVVMWYDARNDASNARFATYIATSTDGGQTWTINDGTGIAPPVGPSDSPQTFVNPPKQAVDAITGKTVTLEPIPGNEAASENTGATPFGFGMRQSIIAYDGRITPFWTANLNTTGRSIYTATVRVAAGPRLVDSHTGIAATGTILDSDMGSVSAQATITDSTGAVSTFLDRTTLLPIDPLAIPRATPAVNLGDSLKKTKAIYNDRFAPDGTRRIDGFKVVFDRPIDVRTFTAADIIVEFRDPQTPLSAPATTIATLDPVPVFVSSDSQDNNEALIPGDPFATAGGQILASTFFVPFKVPQEKVGTYSYRVGPNIRTLIWNPLGETPISAAADPVTSPNLPAAYD
jgi:hypothetical protein